MTIEQNSPIDERSLDVAANFVNKVFVMRIGNNVRIVFSESLNVHATRYRAAVVMTTEDARDLAQAISITLQPLAVPEPQSKEPNSAIN